MIDNLSRLLLKTWQNQEFRSVRSKQKNWIKNKIVLNRVRWANEFIMFMKSMSSNLLFQAIVEKNYVIINCLDCGQFFLLENWWMGRHRFCYSYCLHCLAAIIHIWFYRTNWIVWAILIDYMEAETLESELQTNLPCNSI